MSGAADLVIRNWHYVDSNVTQNVSTSRVKTNAETGQSTGTVTLLTTMEIVVEAWLVPPLDPYDATDPTGTVQSGWVNPAAAPSASPTASPPGHGCYVDTSNVFFANLLGGGHVFFDRPWGSTHTPWRLKRGAFVAGYANDVIPVIRWQAVFSSTGTKSVANVTWTGTLNADRFHSLWPNPS